ncbi:MAG: hypothetical protein VB081_02670, partial [Christensenella sp.]|nr:hypothetical protein [Christensenella sp.]
MKIALGAPQQRLFELLRQAGVAPAYLVGGYVRNKLLGFAQGDMDIASPFPPQALTGVESPEIELTQRAYGLGTMVIKQRFENQIYP